MNRVLRGGKFFRGLFPHGSGGSHGDNQPLSVAVFKMNTTTFCGWFQTNPQRRWDLQEKIPLYVKFVKRVLENPYSHTHPPYHVGNHGHDLVIMRSPKNADPK